MAEVESFMAQFQEEDIELIWGYSKDHNLEEGAVKVTVLATGFGMKDIPGMEPVIKKEEEKEEKISREDQERLDQMLGVFYKPEYKVYIFKGDEMYNDEFLEALDNSPTYKRSAMELEKIMNIVGSLPKEESPEQADTNVVEENRETEPAENNDDNNTENEE